MHDCITKFLDSNDISVVIVISFDFCKAFDSVPHFNLLEKVFNFGAPKTFVQFLDGYLCEKRFLSEMEVVNFPEISERKRANEWKYH